MNFRSNGKLLITGEYLILKGARALAVPTTFFQELIISDQDDSTLIWESFFEGKSWFKGKFNLPDLKIIESSNQTIAQKLEQLLKKAQHLNPGFLNNKSGHEVVSKANFNSGWGLGSSSSLISNISYWAEIDPYVLHHKVSSGSGYDIANARTDSPLFYKIENGEKVIKKIDFEPVFKDRIYFVYLGQKQDSAKSVESFLKGRKKFRSEVELISELSIHIATAQNIDDFEYYIKEHENILSSILKTQRIKVDRFNDFDGEIKSLGAWGGDFALATWQGIPNELRKYFERKNLNTIFTFDEMIK
jgi:mevalonate kinase